MGAESPTFVEPVSKRKDGIEAMFAKQKQTQASPAKRPRSPATPEPQAEKDEDGHESKKVKVEVKTEDTPVKKPVSKKSVKAAAGPSSPTKNAGVKSPPPSPTKKTKYKVSGGRTA